MYKSTWKLNREKENIRRIQELFILLAIGIMIIIWN